MEYNGRSSNGNLKALDGHIFSRVNNSWQLNQSAISEQDYRGVPTIPLSKREFFETFTLGTSFINNRMTFTMSNIIHMEVKKDLVSFGEGPIIGEASFVAKENYTITSFGDGATQVLT